MSRIQGGGDQGHWLETTFIPDSTFKAEISHLVSSGTKVVGKLVQLATSANYTVTSPAASADPDGDIVAFEHDSVNTWRLTCRIWGYTTIDSARKNANCIIKFPFAATPSLGQAVKVTGGTYRYARGTATDGVGFIVSVDNTNAEFDAII
jgi:hypothetical protein